MHRRPVLAPERHEALVVVGLQPGLEVAGRKPWRIGSVVATSFRANSVVAPPGKKFGSFTRPVVRFGKPLDFSRYDGLENDRYILRSITDEIMYEIMRLSGQEYVDMYATKAKAFDKEAARKGAAEAKQVAYW